VRQAGLDWDEGYFEQAEGHLRLAFAALPDSMTPVKNIARMKMQMSSDPEYVDQKEVLLTDALILLDQVIVKYPEAYDLQVNKANVLVALDRGDEARDIFDTLLAEHGDDTDLLLDIANLAIDQQDFERAADFYVMTVDLNQADTDASNDEYNKDMLVNAGVWYSDKNVGRYDDALVVLDRAADLEIIPTDGTMLNRLRAYFNYGKETKKLADSEADPVAKQEIQDKATGLFNRAIEIGVAMTNNFPANANGFFYLSLAQLEIGDYAASEANYKTYEELSPDTP
jgi:tetratricopeptide (TPR) repeat protein